MFEQYVYVCFAVGTEPMIEHGYACKSTLELSCGSSINSSNGFWTFYRNQSNNIQNMAKIIYNDNKCTVKTSYSIDCKCISGYHVNCILYNSTVGNTRDRWRFSKFSDGSTNLSTEIRLPTQGRKTSQHNSFVCNQFNPIMILIYTYLTTLLNV